MGLFKRVIEWGYFWGNLLEFFVEITFWGLFNWVIGWNYSFKLFFETLLLLRLYVVVIGSWDYVVVFLFRLFVIRCQGYSMQLFVEIMLELFNEGFFVWLFFKVICWDYVFGFLWDYFWCHLMGLFNEVIIKMDP